MLLDELLSLLNINRISSMRLIIEMAYIIKHLYFRCINSGVRDAVHNLELPSWLGAWLFCPIGTGDSSMFRSGFIAVRILARGD
jgi:hypothetical protein